MNSVADLVGISRCNCSCFCKNCKYETDSTLGVKLDSDQFIGGKGPSQVCLLSVIL